MPLVYIHGVKVRSAAHGEGLAAPFKKWLGPALGSPGDFSYIPIFWGDHAAKFRWDLQSRPLTRIARAGSVAASTGMARTAPVTLANAPSTASPAPAGPVIGGPAAASSQSLALSNINPEDRADVLADLYLAARRGAELTSVPPVGPISEDQRARLPAIAAQVAEEKWDTAPSGDKQRLSALLQEVDQRLAGVASAGAADWFSRIGEVAQRAVTMPGDLLSTGLGELRPLVNEFVANFIGDVLAYIHERGDKTKPGPIPLLVLEGLREAKRKADGQPIVVLTHSMGGQLFYDAITHFVETDPELKSINIDHWITCGSQVSFFAELSQFRDQDLSIRRPAKLHRPSRVKRWTNFYDENDPVGYVMEPVFSGVEDTRYDTGFGFALAHTGFLERPSFFDRVAKTVRAGLTP